MSCNICVKDVAKSLTDPQNVMELINYLHCSMCVRNHVDLWACVCLRKCLHTAAACSLRSQAAAGWNLIFCLLGSLTPLSPLLHPQPIGAETLGLCARVIGCNCLFTSHLSHTQLSSVLLESSYFSPPTVSDLSSIPERSVIGVPRLSDHLKGCLTF